MTFEVERCHQNGILVCSGGCKQTRRRSVQALRINQCSLALSRTCSQWTITRVDGHGDQIELRHFHVRIDHYFTLGVPFVDQLLRCVANWVKMARLKINRKRWGYGVENQLKACNGSGSQSTNKPYNCLAKVDIAAGEQKNERINKLTIEVQPFTYLSIHGKVLQVHRTIGIDSHSVWNGWMNRTKDMDLERTWKSTEPVHSSRCGQTCWAT